MTSIALVALVKIALIIAGLMTAAAYLVLLERRMAAWIQDRRGPNRVGIPLTNIRMFGLGQPIADGVKFLAKEEFTPGHVDRFLYFAAPLAIFATAVVIFAVIPFGSVLPSSVNVEGEQIDLVVAPHVDVGMIFVFAVSSVGVYGVVLGSWASNNKYSFLGGLRSGAQLIAYEIPLGLGLLGVVLMSGSLRLDTIISGQAESGLWNVLAQPLGFVVFVVAAVAEAERLPFDLPEAEQELVGGYHTEYSGIKLMMYLVAEFAHMITAAFLIVILFLGGWHLWGMPTGDDISWPVALARIAILLGKVFGVILMFMVVRWSWPRFRFDQLMNVAWRLMLPWGMVNVVVVAVLAEYGGPLAATLGVSRDVVLAVVGWCTLAMAWWIGTVWDPTGTDNRPIGRDAEGGD
jgi:NADH-quinone oxidoreductase subunit H